MRPRQVMTPRRLLVGMLTGFAVAAVAGSMAVAQSTHYSRASAGLGVYSAPSWFPLRYGSNGIDRFKVGCVKDNCAGPYHGYWAADLIDPANAPGAPVFAAGAGQVTNVVSSYSACGGPGTPGNFVAVYHGNNQTSFYYHLKTATVNVGDWVDENTQVGTVGSVGYVSPCPPGVNHLHFEIDPGNVTAPSPGAAVNAGSLNACHGAALVQYSESTWNSVQPETTTAYSDGTLCKYNGKIVQDGAGHSWLVDGFEHRRSVTTTRAYNCLRARAVSDAGAIPLAALAQLANLPGVHAQCPIGDVNDNGVVDLPDFSTVLTNYATAGYKNADINGDGNVDGGDLAIILNNYGRKG